MTLPFLPIQRSIDIFKIVIRMVVFPPLVNLDSTSASSDQDKATLFNKCFHFVFTTSSLSLPPLAEMPKPTTSLNQIQFSDYDVYEQLTIIHLDVSKAKGIDGIGQ